MLQVLPTSTQTMMIQVCTKRSTIVAPVLRDSGPSLQTMNAAKSLLWLREGHRVPQVALTDVMGSCHEMGTYMVNCFRQEIQEKWHLSEFGYCTIQWLENVLNRHPHIHLKVSTPHIDLKNCVDHFSCLVSFTVLFVCFIVV